MLLRKSCWNKRLCHGGGGGAEQVLPEQAILAQSGHGAAASVVNGRYNTPIYVDIISLDKIKEFTPQYSS